MPARRNKKPSQRPWQPLTRGTPNPKLLKAMREAGETDLYRIQVWSNDVYSVTVRPFGVTHPDRPDWKGELLWLSIKTHTRRPIRDWRHLQQIKNEVAGPEREACEIFPAESRLVDTSNEYHLFVLPEGESFGFGYPERDIVQPDEIKTFNEEQKKAGYAGKARQRPWQRGLTTGQEEPSG